MGLLILPPLGPFKSSPTEHLRKSIYEVVLIRKFYCVLRTRVVLSPIQEPPGIPEVLPYKALEMRGKSPKNAINVFIKTQNLWAKVASFGN